MTFGSKILNTWIRRREDYFIFSFPIKVRELFLRKRGQRGDNTFLEVNFLTRKTKKIHGEWVAPISNLRTSLVWTDAELDIFLRVLGTSKG